MHLIVGAIERIEGLGLSVVVIQDVNVVFFRRELAGGGLRYHNLLGSFVGLLFELGSLHAALSDVKS